MRNFTKYSNDYLDKMLPQNASCLNCCSVDTEKMSVRETGEFLIVSSVCNGCGTVFSDRHHHPTLTAMKKKEDERLRKSKQIRQQMSSTMNMSQPIQKPINKKPVVTKQQIQEKPITKKEKYQKRCYTISSAFNIVTLIIFLFSVGLISFECYCLFYKYQSEMLYSIPATFITAIGLLIIFQLFSIIYEGLGMRTKVNQTN